MDIKEISKLQSELELKLTNLIYYFEEQTDKTVYISKINIENVEYGKRITTVVVVR